MGTRTRAHQASGSYWPNSLENDQYELSAAGGAKNQSRSFRTVTNESSRCRARPWYATATNPLTYDRAAAESSAVAALGYTEFRTLNISVESVGTPAAAEPMMKATWFDLAATSGASVPP